MRIFTDYALRGACLDGMCEASWRVSPGQCESAAWERETWFAEVRAGKTQCSVECEQDGMLPVQEGAKRQCRVGRHASRMTYCRFRG